MPGWLSRNIGSMVPRAAALAALALLAVVDRVDASPNPGSTMTYRVDHEEHGLLGMHRLTFSRTEGNLVVEVASEITVEFFSMTVFRYAAKRREVWRDGRMIAYESDTHDDGTDVRVTAKAAEDGLIIAGPSGRRMAALGVFPTHPWKQSIVDAEVLMHTTTGELLEVAVTEVGPETLILEGRPIQTTKYRMSGDHEREIWFNDKGDWVLLRFFEYGDAVTYTLMDPHSASDLAER